MESLLSEQRLFWDDEDGSSEVRVVIEANIKEIRQALREAQMSAEEASRAFHEFGRQMREQVNDTP